jgi:hypothetical protein
MKMNRHDAHIALAAQWRRLHPDSDDELLYIGRPVNKTVRYVWRSGVKLGLAASTSHLLDLWAQDVTPNGAAT